ncbi:ATPase P, partial [Halorubrum kocurii JCM 14978]
MSAPDCTLCELPTEGVDVTDGGGNEFCCTGCRDVYEALGDVDVDAEAVRERRREGGDGAGDAGDDTAVPADHEATFLEVDGMHCATCESFLEMTAGGKPG